MVLMICVCVLMDAGGWKRRSSVVNWCCVLGSIGAMSML